MDAFFISEYKSEVNKMLENKFELRKLCAKDIFVMVKIISKIGISEFKNCFKSTSVSEKIKSNMDFSTIGLEVIIEMVGIVLGNLPKCESDIYSFLADLSGKKSKEISELDMSEFAEMIKEVLAKDEFKDFFTVVSKYFIKAEKQE